MKELFELATQTKGFMPHEEGMALYQAAIDASNYCAGPMVEIGAYCGKSTIYIGAACDQVNSVLFSVDHHRGSEENQSGWEHHDPELVNPLTGRMDTLPTWRETIESAKLEHCVIAIVGESITIASNWSTPLSFLFIDGGHGEDPAWSDYRNWTPHIALNGILAIHDVFENSKDGGRPPYEIYVDALKSGSYQEISTQGSLRILKKTSHTER